MIKGQLLENASENSKLLWQNVLEIKNWLWLRPRNVWLVLEDVKKLKARKKEWSQHVEMKINNTFFKKKVYKFSSILRIDYYIIIDSIQIP